MTVPGCTPKEQFQRVPGGPCSGLAPGGAGSEAERLGEVGTQRAKEGVQLTQEAWAPGCRHLLSMGRGGPRGPHYGQAHGGVAPSAGHPHANPVITGSGFPLQTPGSTWFLQSHRIWPGLSSSWPGGGGPWRGRLPGLLPCPEARGQGRSTPPSASKGNAPGLSVIPLGARNRGASVLGLPQLRVPLNAPRAPCQDQSWSRAIWGPGMRWGPGDTQEQSFGPEEVVAGSALRRDLRGRRGNPGGPHRPQESALLQWIRERLTGAPLPGCARMPHLQRPPPIGQACPAPHPGPRGYWAATGTGAVDGLPADLRGLLDSGW